MNRFVEFHLGRTIALSALSEMLTEISIERFHGFVRVHEAGEGRFVLSFPRQGAADISLFTLIRENPSQLYAERITSVVGDWVMEVFMGSIVSRTGALVATDDNDSLHQAPGAKFYPTFADWLLAEPERAPYAQDNFERFGAAVPLQLRGVVTFHERQSTPRSP